MFERQGLILVFANVCDFSKTDPLLLRLSKISQEVESVKHYVALATAQKDELCSLIQHSERVDQQKGVVRKQTKQVRVDQRKEDTRCGRRYPHHPIVLAKRLGIVRQVVHEQVELVRSRLKVRVGPVLVEQLVVFLMRLEVLVDDPLLLVQVSGQLELHIDLVVLVLDLAQLFVRDSDFLEHGFVVLGADHDL